ncbi:MAG: hypothetical protein KKF44_10500 [Nanoarchaeota archaeon]|nr:hypothetical protein [Nanoarchaeota archaeon]
MKTKYFSALACLLVLFSFVIIPMSSYALTLTGPYLSPAAVENRNKNNPLLCYWSVSADTTTVEVNWYNSTNLIRYELNPSNNQSTLNPTNFNRGETLNCSVNITDGGSGEEGSIITTILNAEPIFQSADNEVFTEDQEDTVILVATDADNDQMVYSYSSDITFDTFNNLTGQLVWNPANESIGDHIVFLQVVDDHGGVSQIKNVTYTVNERNDPPYFSMSGSFPLSVNQNETLNYAFTGHDEENEDGPFNFTVNSSYFDLYGYEAFNITSDDDLTGYLQFIYSSPTQRKNGTYDVTLTLCETATGGCNITTFALTVLSTNFEPYFTSNESLDSWSQEGNMTFYINASDVNEYDTLTFSEIFPVNPLCNFTNPWTISTISPSIQNATGMVNFSYPTTLTNAHVDCNEVTITVIDDAGGSASINITFNISNTNDAPILNEVSMYSGNSHPSINFNLTNLTAIVNIPLVYRLNMTDLDLFIESAGEVITYGTNASLCIDCPIFSISAAGIVNLNVSNETFFNRLFYYSVNVTDVVGSSDTKYMTIYVRNNTIPRFNQSLGNYSISEDGTFNLQVNGTDDDINDFIDYSDSSGLFNINSSGLISFTSDCSLVDLYTMTITINDSYGAEISEELSLNISFEADAPYMINFSKTAVEEIHLSIPVESDYIIDEDLNSTCINQTDSLTYTYEVPSELSNYYTTGGGTYFHITPNNGAQGIYVINVTVNDSYGLWTVGHFDLTVLNQSRSPIIYNVTAANSTDLTLWISTSIFADNVTSIEVDEEEGDVVFNHTTSDPDGDQLIYSWYVNNTYISDNYSYIRNFDYNSSGDINITLIVADNISGYMLHNVSFTWNISVDEVNRAPYMTSNFTNISFGGSSYYRGNYFTEGDSRFVDPDNDPLNFSVNLILSSINHTRIEINGSNLYIFADTIGIDYVVFTASDGINSTSSNTVAINVTWVAEAETETETQTDATTRTRTITQTIIQEVEVETPIYLDIIAPEPITLYMNNTIRAPITLINNGNITLKGIRLSAVTNNSLVSMFFTDDFFPQLKQGERVTTDLIITSYKTFSNYEIVVYANITDPDYSDSAIIYINSLEKTKGDMSVTNTKVTFARDLLSSNPECMELNEFMKLVELALQKKDYEEASKILDSIVQGCKYLVAQKNINVEKPRSSNILDVLTRLPQNTTFLIVVITAIIGIFIFSLATAGAKPKIKKK